MSDTPRSRLVPILLAVSLTANAFFIAGAAYTFAAKHRWSPRADMIERVSERLSLSDSQEAALRELRRQSSERRQALRGSFEEMRQGMLAEISKPEFDRGAVIALLQARSQERAEVFADIAGGLHAYIAGLSPEQRAEFLEMAEDRGFLFRLLSERRRR